MKEENLSVKKRRDPPQVHHTKEKSRQQKFVKPK